MDRDKLKAAVAEAERFLKRAKSLPAGDRFDSFPLEQGAIRRSSMDLTRALAALRRPA